MCVRFIDSFPSLLLLVYIFCNLMLLLTHTALKEKKGESFHWSVKGPIYCVWKLLSHRHALELHRPLELSNIHWPSPLITAPIFTRNSDELSHNYTPNSAQVIKEDKMRKGGVPTRRSQKESTVKTSWLFFPLHFSYLLLRHNKNQSIRTGLKFTFKYRFILLIIICFWEYDTGNLAQQCISLWK